MKRILFLFMLFFLNLAVLSQTDSGNLEVYLGNLINSNPGDSGDTYKIPTASDMTNWENCITNFINGNLAQARLDADNVNYEIVEYLDTGLSGVTHYVLKEKANQQNYWGTYVFGSTNELSVKLVLQAPHSNFDFNTGKQAIYSFLRIKGYALFLNGTHRCNHSQASTCSGTTSVCGMSEAFKISDLAHNTNSVFQKTTEIIHDTFSDSVFFQLHGFTKQASDPYVILSNGTDQTPSGTDYAVALQNALSNQDPSLTFEIAHVDNWTRLVGFTNTQGRYINQSTNPCSSSASTSSGRFVHVEQEKTKLRDNVQGWFKMFAALDALFTATVSAESYRIPIQFKSENPLKEKLEFHVENAKTISLYTVLGEQVYFQNISANQSDFLIDTSKFSSGIYLLKVTTEKGVATKKLIRE